MSRTKGKRFPEFESDTAAEAFVAEADLTDYDWSDMRPHSFEFAPKSKQVNMRFSEQLLDAVKARAAERGMSYQRFIRQALEAAIQGADERR
jgi:predicted DNA binding CopG/RHH family protein